MSPEATQSRAAGCSYRAGDSGGLRPPPLSTHTLTAQRQLAAVGFLGVWAVMERAGPAVDLKRGRSCPTENKVTYRVKLFFSHSCTWRVVPFTTLAAACRWRSECEKRGWLATLMPPSPLTPSEYMGI